MSATQMYPSLWGGFPWFSVLLKKDKKWLTYAREDLLQDFRPNLMLLNEMIYVTKTVKGPVTITQTK